MRLSILVSAMVLTVPALAQSDPSASTGSMLPHCRDWIDRVPTKPADTSLAGICAGTVAAALHYSTLLEAPYKSCPPKGTTNGQAIGAVVRYLEAHPEVGDQDFRMQTLSALRTTWPCPP
jgi:Ssp1 endopeptidase immunity protein Rap1a